MVEPTGDFESKVVGKVIPEGAGGIKKAVEEGKGWNDEQILAYAKTIPDNHPFFAESLEVSTMAMRRCILANRQVDDDDDDDDGGGGGGDVLLMMVVVRMMMILSW